MTEPLIDPAITVILATSNRAPALGAAIKMVLAQDEGSLELLIMDCGSEDDTELVVRAFDDNRIRFLSLDHNDRSGACVEGCRQAKGKYLAFMDVHTWWDQKFLAGQRHVLDANFATVGVSYAGAACQSTDGDVYRLLPPGDYPEGNIGEALFKAPLIAPSSMLIRAEVLKHLLGKANRFWFQDDHLLSIRLAALTEFVPNRERLVVLKDIDGHQSRGLDPASDARGEALMRAMEEMPGMVSARFGRRCLASYYGQRADVEMSRGEVNNAFGYALKVLIYTPFSIRAWTRLARLAVSGPDRQNH